ncbi:ArsR/SmtB family transcription factor [Ornithinimicrobium pratense]|uniref:Helix-turn-helix transcriptional regulator n=1 Tax=Ornithinimicrobium pratense TaxID=2593973 RepID=A0A5J6V2T8_9MICO|nr:metalloregulator ArsR/SmtB family transcription factor [Ornithinimicrobium pratense]QFG68045.1 helix-turn-helix transcriptional regulator [Ornithinimicrobium pratense]
MSTSAAPWTDVPSTIGDVCCPGTDCELLAKDRAEDLALVFKALADPTRVRLLQYLAEAESGTACACHLPAALEISQPTLSFHMRKLHDAGLVDRDKRGRWVHYTVRPESLQRVRGFLDLQVDTATSRCC